MVIGNPVSSLEPFLYNHITHENREWVSFPDDVSYSDEDIIKWGYERLGDAVGYWKNKDARIISWFHGPRLLRDNKKRMLNVCKMEDMNKDLTLKELSKYDIGLVHEGVWTDHIELVSLANLYNVLSRHCIVTMVTVEPL